MKNKFLLFSFVAFLLLSINVSFGKRAETPQPTPQQPQVGNPSDEQTKLFEAIKGKFDAGDYTGARLEAVRFIESYPSSHLCSEAQYIIANVLSQRRETNPRQGRNWISSLKIIPQVSESEKHQAYYAP